MPPAARPVKTVGANGYAVYPPAARRLSAQTARFDKTSNSVDNFLPVHSQKPQNLVKNCPNLVIFICSVFLIF